MCVSMCVSTCVSTCVSMCVSMCVLMCVSMSMRLKSQRGILCLYETFYVYILWVEMLTYRVAFYVSMPPLFCGHSMGGVVDVDIQGGILCLYARHSMSLCHPVRQHRQHKDIASLLRKMTYKERASYAFRHPVRQHQQRKDIVSRSHRDVLCIYETLCVYNIETLSKEPLIIGLFCGK